MTAFTTPSGRVRTQTLYKGTFTLIALAPVSPSYHFVAPSGAKAVQGLLYGTLGGTALPTWGQLWPRGS